MSYPAADDIITFHGYIMRRWGLAPAPLRNRDALESAVARPQTAAYYEGADLIEQAAILTVAISQAQAFLDGNKRTAVQTLAAFLGANGQLFAGDSLELAKRLEAVAAQTDDRAAATAAFAAWVRDRVVAD